MNVSTVITTQFTIPPLQYLKCPLLLKFLILLTLAAQYTVKSHHLLSVVSTLFQKSHCRKRQKYFICNINTNCFKSVLACLAFNLLCHIPQVEVSCILWFIFSGIIGCGYFDPCRNFIPEVCNMVKKLVPAGRILWQWTKV